MTVVTAPKADQKVKMPDALAAGEALAREWGPRAAEAEQLRRMPPGFADSVEALGMMPLVRPARYGGYESDWKSMAEFVRPIGRLSGSMAWCAVFLLQHQWVLSHYPVSVQDHVYGMHPNPRIATSFAISGEAEPVPGGYRAKGEWAFGSGGDQCQWAIVGVMVKQPDGPPKPSWMLFKPDQFWMRDTWRATGLKGSGSNNIVVEETFVEEAYALDIGAARLGNHPSRGISDHPLFTAGMGCQFQFALTSPLLATADGLLESFIDFFRDKTGTLAPGKKTDQPWIQLRAGEAAADIAAARTLLYNLNARIMSGDMSGEIGALEFTRDVALIARMALGASDRLFNLSGGRGLAEGNLFGQHWRDVHAMSNHAGLTGDLFLQNYGAYRLTGQPPH